MEEKGGLLRRERAPMVPLIFSPAILDAEERKQVHYLSWDSLFLFRIRVPSLSYNIDLSKVLPKWVTIGSRSSSSVTASGGHRSVLCHCGLVAPLKMALTGFNPGRRFFGCAKWSEKSNQESCNFFLWYDPSTCPRGIEVGPMLTKKIKALESEKSDLEITNKRLTKNIKALESEKLHLKITNKRLKYTMGLSWIVIVVISALWVKTNSE
ncbi:hypothetical protein CJ030_MR3G012319 [Morella rubra]|uniref:GRF-type domain-containing protein n=1 Tax=Morella rubra TaxID=262757 RepID=A0A6A1W3P0_9ROSI|nr:hypothetical protein CJ030_MR3G012319 [Morella rubra]